MKVVPKSLLGILVAFVPLCWYFGVAQTKTPQSSPELTATRIREAGWWPTRGDAPRKSYAGSEACSQCHQQESLTQPLTSMARAASRGAETQLFRSHPTLSLNQPPFLTSLTRDRHGITYTASRGGDAMSGQVSWTMGDGELGQTFILESAGIAYEGQLSYFTSASGLALTPGHVPASPRDLESAFGQRLSQGTAQQCFGCHTTGSSNRGDFDPAHATPGVTCESCHGPGAKHVDAMRNNRTEEGLASILRPGLFDPVKLIDYCGACHRASLDVLAMKDNSAINVRFQPYRLAKSRCWTKPDPRIACTACHNPHEQVVRDVSFYDAKCLACHASKTPGVSPVAAKPSEAPVASQPACPVAASKCVSCHMPKYNVAQMHGSFTDHNIRVLHPGDPFPL